MADKELTISSIKPPVIKYAPTDGLTQPPTIAPSALNHVLHVQVYQHNATLVWKATG